MRDKLTGTINKITFRNEENGWTVAVLMEGKEGETYGRETIIVGSFSTISCGETVQVKGEWSNHARFGKQFKVDEYVVTVPETIMGIKKYLGSGLIKGIGKEMANRIVEKFQEDTIKIIETNIKRLTEVDGIGPKRIEMIRKSWKEQKHIKDIMVFLQGKGVPTGIASRIYKKYGDESLVVIQDNPYRIVSDIWGVGFQTADLIAHKMGIPSNSPIRARAGLTYILSEASNKNGHTYVEHDKLIQMGRKLLDISDWTILEEALKHQIEIEKEMIELEDKLIFPARAYNAEKGISKHLSRLSGRSTSDASSRFEKLADTEKKLNIKLAETQKLAVQTALRSKLMILTGGPGTGKSTIINTIINLLDGKRILLSAPTGRAAKRMSEITHREAKTIHRLLEFSPQNGGFQKNEDSPLFADMIIVDESSMIDIYLMNSLLKAIPDNCSVLFVGDVDQLPSVGTGNVLKDMIASNYIKTITLTEIFRQKGGSKIITNAHLVNRGMMPVLKNKDGEDFYYFNGDEPEKISAGILKLVKDIIPKKFGMDPIKDIQILAPMRKGTIGISKLNETLQEALNDSRTILNRGFTKFKLNDKVMQIKNNYDKNVFNGDVGFICGHNKEEQQVLIDFEDRVVPYDYSEMDEIVLSYAASIHKSQGSEYPCVIIPLHTTHYIMLKRNLLYTGITRAKKLMFLVGSSKAVNISVNNNDIAKRNTYLKEFIREE